MILQPVKSHFRMLSSNQFRAIFVCYLFNFTKYHMLTISHYRIELVTVETKLCVKIILFTLFSNMKTYQFNLIYLTIA